MFAKIFESIYEGTLADHWQALVTFQQMLILADANGKVDMTPAAIHRRTGIPVEIIKAGIAVLEQPDPQSRSKKMDGCRIALLDDGRDWGWFIVNHAEYRKKISAEEKRAADRERIADRRAAGQTATARDNTLHVADSSVLSPQLADVAQAEAEIAEAEDSSVGSDLEQPHARAHEATPSSRADPIFGSIGKGFRAAGFPAHLINLQHPTLVRMVEDALAAGVHASLVIAEFTAAALEAKAQGKTNGLNYTLAMIDGRRKDAAAKGNAQPRAGPGEPRVSAQRAAIERLRDRGNSNATQQTTSTELVPGRDAARDQPAHPVGVPEHPGV